MKYKWNCLFFVMVFFTVSLLFLLGCEKKQPSPSPAPKVIGQCEFFETLPADIAHKAEVMYGDKIKLLGITVNKISGNKLQVSYYWQPLNEPGPYNKAFVIFSDKSKKQLFGNDHDLCENKPFSELKGKFIKETFMVGVPQSASGQKVNVGIGIFAPELTSNVRLKITAAGKTPVDDINTRAVIQEIAL
jgi:hypothetical protein